MSPSGIPTPVARRIDRLARQAHRFHRYAHHPLCIEYEGEVLRVGRRTRLCRGCILAAAGVAAGTAAGAFLAPPLVLVAGAVLASPIAAAAATGKLGGRALPAAGLALALAGGLEAANWAGLALAAAALGMGALLLSTYRRRGPDRAPCASCPESRAADTCRGFTEIVRRERAFRRLSGRILAAAGQ